MSKIVKVTLAVSLISVFLVFGVIAGIRLLFLPKDGVSQRFPYYTTNFSNSLVQNNLENIQVGWKIDTVESIIGNPFNYVYGHSYNLSEVPFSFSAKYSIHKRHFLINYASFMFLVHYDKDSTVVSTTQTWIYD